ncbi:phospholipase D-like domain-containing protein [Pseudomonas protegens]|uniref:phospholipase D-like domain-containing protein n=1 Tax=Pseudomonas protegens TaxID=380021 RepID=UPI000CD21D2F|nr:phospholipase D-like domain-containing protein [Pseudomonas protegens]POA80395.1 phospholipase [Pseudomonas protegens]
MTINPAPYNGIRHKELSQINTDDGKALLAVSAPDFFIEGDDLFAPKRSGNQVRFFINGDDYYRDLAVAIDQAETSIFITSWQVNYDVLLDGQRSLWQCLHQALKSKPALRVFVMPWLSPSGSLGTYDFETMLAIFQLNFGLGGARAFCTPAIQQSDMAGLGSTFSHHQKSVVIDNKIGYVGGIDLAYGRRDDNNFSLDARERRGNDAYNPCIPHLGWMDMDKHVSRNGLLLATLFDLSKPLGKVSVLGMEVSLPSRQGVLNTGAAVQNFIDGPMFPATEWLSRGINSLKETVGAFDPLAEAKEYLNDEMVRLVAELILANWDNLPLAEPLKSQVHEWLQELEAATGQLHLVLRLRSYELIHRWMNETELGRFVAMFSEKGFEALPQKEVDSIKALGASLLGHFYAQLQERQESDQPPYYYLLNSPQPMASKDYSRLADYQPRMPWQDVHSRIEGPSVYDLSRNFIERWNGQQAYIAELQPLAETPAKVVVAVMEWLNLMAKRAGLEHNLDANDKLQIRLAQPKPVWINQPQWLPTEPDPRRGGVSVQVLRSASEVMTKQEALGRQRAQLNLPLPPGISAPSVQANCLKAMLQVISSAGHFIYMENQFFQSDFGDEGELRDDVLLSGPMASLRDPNSLRQDYVERIGLREAINGRDFALIDWREIKAIAEESTEESHTFLNSFYDIWKLNAMGWLSKNLGEEKSLRNPIVQALADRIGRAIEHDQPFHVYLVLPVHPEGKLNDPIVMHQVHLTMQTLVFGEHSLVKRIQRHMALRALRGKCSPEEALKVIERKDIAGDPVYSQQRDWNQYLTLLNLRTWDTLDGRVVTEQIYVHSKLLIADDRVAIVGSANVNDRSLLGNRDSELAMIVRDSTPVKVALDGQHEQQVSQAISQLRKGLWRKHFALSLTKPSSVKPATELEQYLDQPAAKATWQAVQKRASQNESFYNERFDFIPQNISLLQIIDADMLKEYGDGFPCPVWPTWIYRSLRKLGAGGELSEPMPYEERFWKSKTLASVKSFSPPTEVEGFITALPLNWTRGENNDSGLNKTMIADVLDKQDNSVRVAVHQSPQDKGHNL